MQSAIDGTAIDATTAKVLDAAQGLFLSDGFDGVNLDRIAKAAGVSRQTLYNRFGGKEAVFRSMVQRHWSLMKSVDTADPGEPGILSAEAVLNRFGAAIVEFVDDTEQVDFIRLVVSESRRLPWIAEEFYRAGKEPLLRAPVEQLDRLADMGLIQCASTTLAAQQFFGLLQEPLLWPRVMGVDKLVDDAPTREVLIAESVAAIMARYGPPVTGS